MPTTHRWECLLPEDFQAEFDRAPIAYFACGAMEEHGLQNALGTDPYTAYQICLRTADLAGGIVLPPVPLAPAGIPGLSREELRSGQHELFPPSLWVSREACELAYTELMESMADMGFRACMAVGGHWPAELLLTEMEKQHEGRIGDMRFWGGGTLRLLDEATCEAVAGGQFDGHGMMWETSLVMALSEDWVDLPRAARIRASDRPSQLKPQSDEAIAKIAEANADLGNRLLDAAAAKLSAIAERMLD